MNKTLTAMTLALVAFGVPALAQDKGDAEAGAKVFAKCQTCHVVADAEGVVLAGKAGKIGPNLYGLPGRVAGSYEGFKYGASIVQLGETGFVWDEAAFTEYLVDPAKYLKAKLDDKKAKSLMVYKLPKEKEAHDVWAYISSLSPAAVEGAEVPAVTN